MGMESDRSPVIDPGAPSEQIYRILVGEVCKSARFAPSGPTRVAAMGTRRQRRLTTACARRATRRYAAGGTLACRSDAKPDANRACAAPRRSRPVARGDDAPARPGWQAGLGARLRGRLGDPGARGRRRRRSSLPGADGCWRKPRLLACGATYPRLGKSPIMASRNRYTAALNIADLRREYHRASLTEADVDPDPLRQFQTWLHAAVRAELPEPTAMTLATVGADGTPSARIVLLKGVDPGGFVFFTNYDSRKGGELGASPAAALLFHWVELERQVRVEGLADC